MAARVSQEAHFDTGRGSFPRDVEHSRDPPERVTSTHSGTIQDVRWQNRWPCGVLERKTRSSNELVVSFVSEAASS